MGDHSSDESIPLLTNNNSSSSSILNPEDIIEPYLKSLTWRQILQTLLTCLSSFCMGQQTYISIFSDAKPKWHCTDPGDQATCNASYNFCELPSDAWSWDKPAYTSTVSEWSLQCASNPIISGLPASSFFVGCLFGGIILFFIGDSFGRKKILTISCVVMSFASFFSALSNNVWTYSTLRFVSGIGRAVTGSCGLVLAKEIVGKQWQGKMETFYFFNFSLGYMVLSIVSYYTQYYSWRVLYLSTSIPAILYCVLLHFCGYESPRWLLSQDRSEEAIAVLRSISSSKDLISWTVPTGIAVNHDHKSKGSNIQMLSFFKILMEEKEILRQLLLTMIVGTGIGIVFFGMTLGVNSLDFDIYWNVLLNASFQVPALVLFILTVSKWKRRSSLLGLSIVAGVCSILLCFMVGEYWKNLQIGFELVSSFCSYVAFVLLLIYTAELFPIYIRNSAVAMVWLTLMLGGAISPVLIAAGGDNNVLSYGVFGVLVIITGLLVILLPETLDSVILDNNEDKARQQV